MLPTAALAATTSSSPSIALSSLYNTLKSPINPQALKVQGFKIRTHFQHQIRSNGGQAAVGAGKVLSLASIRSFPTLGLETSVFKKEKITLAGQTEMEKVTLAGQDELDPAVKEAFDVAYTNIYAFHCAQMAPEKNIENMRGQEINGAGINANFAVHQDVDGRAIYVAFGWSNASGSFATTLEQEYKSDTFGEQGFLLGATDEIAESLSIRYAENGMKEELAYKYNAKCVIGIISRTISTNGMHFVFKSLSKEGKKKFIPAYRPPYNPCTDMLYEGYEDFAFGNEICSHVLNRGRFHFAESNAFGSFATTLEQERKSVIFGELEQGILGIAESLSTSYTENGMKEEVAYKYNARYVRGIISRIISTKALLSVYNFLSEEGKIKSNAAYRPSYNP